MTSQNKVAFALVDAPERISEFDAPLCGTSFFTSPSPENIFPLQIFGKRSEILQCREGILDLKVYFVLDSTRISEFTGFRVVILKSGLARITLECGGTDSVNQTFPPITEPSPITVSPPRIVAPA